MEVTLRYCTQICTHVICKLYTFDRNGTKKNSDISGRYIAIELLSYELGAEI